MEEVIRHDSVLAALHAERDQYSTLVSDINSAEQMHSLF